MYHAPAEMTENMPEMTPEQMQEGMKPWMEWAAKCGEHLVDMGNPLSGGQVLKQDGSNNPSTNGVSGYSIIQANDMEHAKSFLEGHPHLMWDPRTSIEVHEVTPLPM